MQAGQDGVRDKHEGEGNQKKTKQKNTKHINTDFFFQVYSSVLKAPEEWV